MNITFNPYVRRDGKVMLYVNRSNGVSVGLSGDRPFSSYGKGVTPGQRNAIAAALATFRAHAAVFSGDLAQHTETGLAAVSDCDLFQMAGTDVANIGGMAVGRDGPYIVRDGLILRCGTYEEPE